MTTIEIDSYYCEGKYKNGDRFHLDNEDLMSLIVETNDYDDLEKESLKYFIRFSDGEEMEI